MDEENKVEVNETTNAPVNERKGFNITSMILGIISIVCFCWWYVSIPCAIIAIIFSVAGKKDAGKGMGTAGMILGIISLGLLVLLILGVGGLISLDGVSDIVQSIIFH